MIRMVAAGKVDSAGKAVAMIKLDAVGKTVAGIGVFAVGYVEAVGKRVAAFIVN